MAHHHGGDENVWDGAGLGADERFLRDADDLKNGVADAEGAAEGAGVAAEAAGPIAVGKDGVGIGAEGEVEVGREEAAECGLDAEGGEHVARDVEDAGFFDFGVGAEGEVGAVGGGLDGDEFGGGMAGVGAGTGRVAHDLEDGPGG